MYSSLPLHYGVHDKPEVNYFAKLKTGYSKQVYIEETSAEIIAICVVWLGSVLVALLKLGLPVCYNPMLFDG